MYVVYALPVQIVLLEEPKSETSEPMRSGEIILDEM
jgi:hypothetical protein